MRFWTILLKVTDAESSDPIGTLVELEFSHAMALEDVRVLLNRHHSQVGLRRNIGCDLEDVAHEILSPTDSVLLVPYDPASTWIESPDPKTLAYNLRSWMMSSSDSPYWARLHATTNHLKEVMGRIKKDRVFQDAEQAINDLVMLGREVRGRPTADSMMICIKTSIGMACGRLATEYGKAIRLV